jgi:hypothetical protein
MLNIMAMQLYETHGPEKSLKHITVMKMIAKADIFHPMEYRNARNFFIKDHHQT